MKQIVTSCSGSIFFAVIGIVAIPGCKASNELPSGTGADPVLPSGTGVDPVLPSGTGAEPVLPPPPVVVAPANDNAAGQTATLAAAVTSDKKTYTRGQIVRFTLKLRNTGKSLQKLTFNSGQSFDLTATPAGRAEPVWRWSHDKMFTMALREVTLKPGETQTWNATWEQTDNDDNPVQRGEYSIAGRITANGGIDTPPLTITLAK